MKHTLLCGSCSEDRSVGTYLVGHIGIDGICAWCGRLADRVFLSDVTEPRIVLYGVMSATTSTALDLIRNFVWDVNGYYRDLGVPTDATRKQIKDRYQEIEGWSDPRLTYITKVLLSDKRASYDATPLGHLWYDRYLREAARRESVRRAAEQREMAEVEEETGYGVDDTADQVDEGTPIDMTEKSDSPFVPTSSFGWGWYALDTAWIPDLDISRIRDARALTLEALAQAGVVRRLAFGITDRTGQPWVTRTVGLNTVIFFDRGACFGPEDAATLAERLQ